MMTIVYMCTIIHFAGDGMQGLVCNVLDLKHFQDLVLDMIY